MIRHKATIEVVQRASVVGVGLTCPKVFLRVKVVQGISVLNDRHDEGMWLEKKEVGMSET